MKKRTKRYWPKTRVYAGVFQAEWRRRMKGVPRSRRLLSSTSSSTRLPGPLVRLTAFPTAVFDRQLDEWQLMLPGES